MEPAVSKLSRKLGDTQLAKRLVEAGLGTPGKIRRAKDKDIKAVPGIGQSGVDKVREVFPRR